MSDLDQNPESGIPPLPDEVVAGEGQTFTDSVPIGETPTTTPTEAPDAAPTNAATDEQPSFPSGEVSSTETATSDLSVTDNQNNGEIGTAQTDDVAFDFPAPKENNNATLTKPYAKTVDRWDDLATVIALPPDTAARTINYTESQPNDDLVSNDAGVEWAEAVGEGVKHGSLFDNMLPAAQREGADFRQSIKNGESELSIAQPRLADDQSPMLSGERGVLRLRALLGQGALIQIPLWHSGFWITLKAPSEIELLDAFEQMSDNKINFGRITNGLAFANHAVFSNATIVDLAMKNLFETSVKDLNSVQKIRSMIKAPDLHILAWGLACALYPRGFQFERSVLDPKGQVAKKVAQILNVGACLWVDRSSLNEWQLNHMARRIAGTMGEESVKLYVEHFTRGKSRSVALDKNINMTMRTPSIDEYLTAGQMWVDELATAVNEAFTQEDDLNRRNALVIERAKATSMRQYSHWVESFEGKFGDTHKTMAEREWVEKACSSFSGDNEIRDAYYKAMKEYINDSTVALVGVPQVHPDEANLVKPRFENIIPLDPVSVFFTLLSQKTQQIRMRP